MELGTQTFNLLFTALPIIILGIYDTDVNADYALRYPQLYADGRLARGLNVRLFWSWTAGALLEAVAIFFVVVSVWRSPDTEAGSTPYVFEFGTVLFSCVIAAVTLRVAAEMHKHHWFFIFFTAGSALLWVPACFVFDAMDSDLMRGGMIRVFRSSTFWLTLLLVCGFTGVRTVAWKTWKRTFHPELRHIVHEVQAVTHDDGPLDRFCDAADLARRTGRSVRDVLDAAALVDAGHKELQAQRRAAQLRVAVLDVSKGTVGAAGLDAARSSASES